MATWLGRMGALFARHWKRTGLAAILAIAAIVGLGVVAGGNFENSFSVPGTDSEQAVAVLKSEFPAVAGDRSTVVFHVKDGTLRAPARVRAIETALAGVAKQPHVTGVASPVGPDGATQMSRDGRTAFATVQYDRPAIELDSAGDALYEQVTTAAVDGVQVDVRGGVADKVGRQEAPLGELIGIALAVILLTILFRSLAAMAVTLIGAAVGVGLGTIILSLLSGVMTLPTFAPTLGLMLGLGAGIDYALLVVGRYREQRAAGDDTVAAVATASRTAGFSVLAAGLIVIVAVLGLLVVGVPFVGGMGIGAAVVVAAVVVASLTILPIALGAFGKRLAPRKAEHAGGSRAFERWARGVVRRPVLATLAGLLLLGALALPATGMRMGMPDDSNKAAGTTQRVAYDELARAFGPGSNGPIVVALSLPGGESAPALARVTRAVAGAEGIVGVSPAVVNKERTAAIVSAIPASSPQAAATSEVITRLRTDVLPAATSGTGIVAHVGGATASVIDMSDQIASRLPLFIGLVVVLAVLLLMAAFRSVWIPLISAAFNLLAIVAAYGAVTLMFNATMPIVSFIPLMMFAILFGLSMDYNVFLLSRIQEAHHRGDGPRDAVVHGVGRIGKVILVAGLIMAGVFAGFIITPDAIIQQLGFGLAIAILIDVLVVRMLLSPAIVALLGAKAWWLPRWLDRVLPTIHLEGEDPDPELAPDGVPATNSP